MKADQKKHLEDLYNYHFKKGGDIDDEGVEFLFELIEQQIKEMSALTTMIGNHMKEVQELGSWQLITSKDEVNFVHEGKVVARLTKDGTFYATKIKGEKLDS